MRAPRKKAVEYIVVHCSATQPSQDIGVADIDKMHKARGWQGIGYHAVIRRSGKIEFGEPFANRGAHAKGFNENGIGVCLVGGIESDGSSSANFTAAQFDSLIVVVEMLILAYGDNVKVVGHRDLSPDANGDGEVDQAEWAKDCPCFDVGVWYETGEVVFAEGTQVVMTHLDPTPEGAVEVYEMVDDGESNEEDTQLIADEED